jgi:hypothetical protein
MKRNLIYHTHIHLGEKIDVLTSKNETVTTELEALSRDGMTITCDQKTLSALMPNTASVAPKRAVILPVCFTLNKINDEIKVRCNVVCVRRLSRNIFQLDMRFREISAQDFELIDHYIEQSLRQQQPLKQQKNLLAKVA